MSVHIPHGNKCRCTSIRFRSMHAHICLNICIQKHTHKCIRIRNTSITHSAHMKRYAFKVWPTTGHRNVWPTTWHRNVSTYNCACVYIHIIINECILTHTWNARVEYIYIYIYIYIHTYIRAYIHIFISQFTYQHQFPSDAAPSEFRWNR